MMRQETECGCSSAGYPPLGMPNCTTEYRVEYDSWYRGSAGQKVDYVEGLSAVDEKQAEGFMEHFKDKNPRLMARITTDWVQVR